MKKQKRPSPLEVLRKSIPNIAQDVPEERDSPFSTGATQLAWCPLQKEAVGIGMCGDVQCERCRLIEEHFPERRWLCTVCAEGKPVAHYYAVGACEECGFESPCLLLVPAA
jgi:hypothetical protein